MHLYSYIYMIYIVTITSLLIHILILLDKIFPIIHPLIVYIVHNYEYCESLTLKINETKNLETCSLFFYT